MIFLYANMVFDTGILFKIQKIDDKRITKRVITLASPQFGYTFGLSIELLLSYHLNSYSLIDNPMKPLSYKPKKSKVIH